MDYPKTLAAARKVKGAEWALADALLEEVGPRGSEARFAECAEYLKTHGIEYGVGYLIALHATARAFRPDDRPKWLTPSVAREAGTPAVLRRAEAEKRERGEDVFAEPPTAREIRATRSTVAAHAREQSGGLKRPTRREISASAEHAPKHELTRTADVLKCTAWTLEAKRNGERVLKQIAGTKLSAAERRELRELVAEVLECWQWVGEAVENPLADEISDYLASL
jgi:hypothetical protein